MISRIITKEHREDLVKALQQMVASVLEQLDAGQVVTMHTHHEGKPVGDVQCGTDDFLYTGWTFGVSVGDYPRRDPTVLNIKVTPDGVKVDYSDGVSKMKPFNSDRIDDGRCPHPGCKRPKGHSGEHGAGVTDFFQRSAAHLGEILARRQNESPRLTYEQRRDRYACKVCGNVPDEYGRLEHGRGCYTQSADGGGDELIDLYGELR